MTTQDMWHSRHSGSTHEGWRCGLGRVWPARSVAGASGTPLDWSWYVTLAAVPMDLSCGHRSQKRRRTLHTVIVAIEGNVELRGVIFGVIIVIFRVIFTSR